MENTSLGRTMAALDVGGETGEGAISFRVLFIFLSRPKTFLLSKVDRGIFFGEGTTTLDVDTGPAILAFPSSPMHSENLNGVSDNSSA